VALDPDNRAESVERAAHRTHAERAPETEAPAEPADVLADPDAALEATDEADGAVVPEEDATAAELEGYVDALQRLKADFDNYRKRSERERQAIGVSSTRELVGDLLPVMDNLERAVGALGEVSPSVVSGVEMVRAQLHDLLANRGVEEIDADGAVFDPALHEAVMTQPSPDHEAGTVVEVIQKGYRHRDVVVRPARVVVAAAP
jgi:molecular chaperone GrpE